ncbi:toll/interleukin-1 receptor domain-containing protein [Butyrivibrio sp. AE2032]|uniref:toll/interleukin-1 receptor domain-containing protein n=1 Tax=Butyrivibrio sp. AE2032 TaxID=1458463 RepID=UPI000554F74B|nr:toll/interleukin-1 receptor domain-containing protein [Butyrivibrio sp. AE2032]
MADTINLKNEFIFISYSFKDKTIAKRVIAELEKKGNRCFFAPRDVTPGRGYAGEIIKAIEKCNTFVLIMTQSAVDSHQVLREINAAVSRNKTIIPLKFEDVVLNDDLQYYLGVSQWIDFRGKDYKEKIGGIESIIEDKNQSESEDVPEIKNKGTYVKPLEELLADGVSVDYIAMREIEIDYLCIPAEKFKMNEEMEGTLDDWRHAIECMEYETSACLVKDDVIIGYCDIYPVKKEAYKELVNGECIIRDDMIEVYGFGGVFPAYIAMIGISPEYEGYSNYYLMFDWLFEHIAYWKKKNIILSSIAISVYSDMLESFVVKLGFRQVGTNPVGGKIYEVKYDELMESSAVKYRYADLGLRG